MGRSKLRRAGTHCTISVFTTLRYQGSHNCSTDSPHPSNSVALATMLVSSGSMRQVLHPLLFAHQLLRAIDEPRDHVMNSPNTQHPRNSWHARPCDAVASDRSEIFKTEKRPGLPLRSSSER